MDVRQLKRFLQICEYGSLLRTSQHQYISQQALSKSLIALEQELGAPLFRRTPRGLELTEVGETLRQHAPGVVEAMDALESAVDDAVKLAGKKVSIGIGAGLQSLLNAPARRELQGRFPDLEITVREHHFLECEALTAHGGLTLSLVNGPVTDPALLRLPLATCPRVVILPRDHPLTARERIALPELADCPLALNINSRCYSLLLSLCGDSGLTLDIQRVSDTITMLNLCSTEGYLSIFPAFLLGGFNLSFSNLVTRPLDCPLFPYPIDLVVSPARYEQKLVKELCGALISIVVENVLNHTDSPDPRS